MQTQANFCFYFTKVDTKFFCTGPALPLISSVGPSSDTKNVFL